MFNYFTNNYNNLLESASFKQSSANIKKILLICFCLFLGSILFLFLLLNIIHFISVHKISQRLRLNNDDEDRNVIYNTKSVNLTAICGISDAVGPTSLSVKVGRIINGDNVQPKHKYPWLVSFRLIDRKTMKIKNHFCAGSLINAEYVLSTAHCFSTRNITRIAVVLGTHSLSDQLNEANIYYISQLYSHPEFDPKKDYINDIALVRLNKPVIKFNYLVRPICLPHSSHDDENYFNMLGKVVTLIGWGYVDYDSKTLATSLKQMNRVISNDSSLCSYIRFNPSTTYCAVNTGDKIQDTCNGDSGGPMMLQMDKQWYVYGMTSFGDTNCNPHKSSYYSKITIYLDWIYEIISK